jgi:hypothetical protein
MNHVRYSPSSRRGNHTGNDSVSDSSGGSRDDASINGIVYAGDDQNENVDVDASDDHDETVDVGNDHNENVGHDESVDVGDDHGENVDVGDDHDENVNAIDGAVVNENGITLCTWNVTGLASKLADNEFLSFVQSSDFICLRATFMATFSWAKDGFVSYCKPAVSLGHMGRKSGGIVVLVKDAVARLVQEVKTDFENLLLFKTSCFGADKNVFIICAYVFPQYSPYMTKKASVP